MGYGVLPLAEPPGSRRRCGGVRSGAGVGVFLGGGSGGVGRVGWGVVGWGSEGGLDPAVGPGAGVEEGRRRCRVGGLGLAVGFAPSEERALGGERRERPVAGRRWRGGTDGRTDGGTEGRRDGSVGKRVDGESGAGAVGRCECGFPLRPAGVAVAQRPGRSSEARGGAGCRASVRRVWEVVWVRACVCVCVCRKDGASVVCCERCVGLGRVCVWSAL